MESDLVAQLELAMTHNVWAVYLGLVAAPFVQEDAAILGAASLSLAVTSEAAAFFAAITCGLTLSNLWKYWAGRAAHSHRWARRLAEKPAVAKAARLVDDRLGLSLMAARFIPGTRIPLYVAAGYFRVDWGRFAFWIVVSSVANVAVFFALFHIVGAVAGEAATVWMPVLGFGGLALFFSVRWVSSSLAGRTRQDGRDAGTARAGIPSRRREGVGPTQD